MVLHVDKNEYTGPWEHGKVFDNCAQATRELGCKQNYNVVLKNFKLSDDGLETSTVNGVTFCYLEQYCSRQQSEAEASYRD
jgi:hypothetical protein